MCSFTTLDFACFVPEQWVNSEAIYSGIPSEYKMTKPHQIKVKLPVIAAVNDPTLLLFEEKPTESLENQKTCYSQIVQLMPDKQSIRALQDHDKALRILSWGNAEHHVKLVIIRDKIKVMLKAAMRGYDQVVGRLLHMKLGIAGEEECESLVLHEIA